MKNIFKLLLVLFSCNVVGQTQTENYVKTVAYKVPSAVKIPSPTITQAAQNITYFDGLGRPVQQIAGKQSTSSKNIITHISYDSFGRQLNEYLPYEASSATLAFDLSAETGTLNFYNTTAYENTANPFSQKSLESSPLNRVLKQASPGNSWVMSAGHEIKISYQTNTATEVKLYKANTVWTPGSGLYEISFVDGGNYVANELFKTVTYDENTAATPTETAGSTVEFKNKQGQVVLKRTYDAGSKHDTYYVYDIYGNLTYVIPPKVDGAAITTDILNGLCYQYKYDNNNRLAEKKLPGKQWEFIVYDRLDRPVATGPVFSPFKDDASVGWIITKYDVYGRPIYTGWSGQAVSSAARYTLQTAQNSATTLFENKATLTIDGIATSYNNSIAPTSFKLLTVNYYDDYNFAGAQTPPTTIIGQTVLTNVKGLPTGTWVRALTTAASTAGETSTTFYDGKARGISTYVKNHLTGVSHTDTELDFTGKALTVQTEHQRLSGGAKINIEEKFTYSPQDRLLTHTHKIGAGTPQLMAANTYNSLGQLMSKNVGNSTAAPLQKVDFTYNVRGWLTEINKTANLQQGTDAKDLFAFKINYNTTQAGISGVNALYNGNISETFWRTGADNTERAYGYQYDNLNRLKNAVYEKTGVTTNAYNESLTYDKNGNIMSLLRNGDSDPQIQPIQVDNLAYTYPANSNQLFKIVDSSNNTSGFNDFNKTSDDYTYDVNGNMITDKNKNITAITYNQLNLPKKITFGTGNTIEYIYNAVGEKLEKIVTEGAVVTTTNYLDGFQYKNTILEFFPTAEGYVKNNSGAYSYVFQYKDHLGNVRLSYVKNASNVLEIIEENNYYPFGLKHKGYNDYVTTSNKYKYNGKELQDELNLNVYDYGARNYDPALGRWMNIDPLAEKSRRFSSYAYALNNPLRFIDPDGMLAYDWIKNNETGDYVWDNNVTSESNTPEGYSYVGKEDNSIIKDIGWTGTYKSVETTKMGYVASDVDTNYGVSHLTTVTAETNINVNANVTTAIDSNGQLSKTFNGVDIGVGVKGTATGTDNIVITGMASTTFGGKDYATGLQGPDGNKSSIQQSGTGASSVSGNIFIPASSISAESGVKVFPGLNVSGGWQNVKDDGSGATPVSSWGLIFPRTYSHEYMPYSGISK